MKLKNLNRVQSSGSWEDVEELGTFEKTLDVKDELSLSDKNLNSDKRVTVFIHDGDGAPMMVVCSSGLSTTVRKAHKGGAEKSTILSALLGLRVIKNEQGHFIVPDAGELERFKVAALKKEKVTYEDLVAF